MPRMSKKRRLEWSFFLRQVKVGNTTCDRITYNDLCHIASTGKQYHSHAATIYKWAQEDAAKGKAAPKQGIPDYSCKEGESL